MNMVQQHVQQALALPPTAAAVWEQVYARPEPTAADVDEDLYGGFVGSGDRRLLNDLRRMKPAQLAQASTDFQDGRLAEILFRYRARNFHDSLSKEEQEIWEEHRAARLLDGAGNARTVDAYFNQIDSLSETASEEDEDILGALYDYAEMIVPSR